MSDGFGIHVSATPSPVKGIGEENASVDSQQQQQQQQQEANLWGNLTCAIKNTAQYASHEFDRFIDAIGFKQSDTETSNSTRQIQLDKTKKPTPAMEPRRAPSTMSTLDKYESAASSLIQSRTSSEISSRAPAEHTRSMPKTRSATPMDPTKRQRLLDLKSQLDYLLNNEDIEPSNDHHVRYTNGSRHRNHLSNTSTTIANPTITNTTQIPSHNDENERMDRLERSIERIQAQMHEMISAHHIQSRPPPTTYRLNNSSFTQPKLTTRQWSHDLQHVPSITPSSAKPTIESLPSPTSDVNSPIPHTQATSPNFKEQLSSTNVNAWATSPKPIARATSPKPIPRAVSPKVNKPYASPIPPHNINGAVKVLPSSTFLKSAFRKQSTIPDEKHINTMQKVVEQIPNYKLRRVDMIPSADGSLKPNPFWIEIYQPKRRYRSKRPLETTGPTTSIEDSSSSKRFRSSLHP
ncbi:predicted protein [Lichtheimia corymbifera JMRC:FSU:9682]|uniref:Uncharacterized protein n=1 Tax=Lichtheimia corymbifera JMRC:FSU:9682 TaxID=1263082 RepID=A0A068RIM0_9FUNG|nr:predicted protein [Lichtheimia corymbifera JMRC:FSU:9682]